GVEIYNLDAQGNRIAFEEYTATTGVAVTNETVEMNLADEKVKFAYTLQPVDATVQDVRFLSVNPDIAVVDNEGYIHPLKAGVTEIQVIAKDGGFKDSLIVTVTETIPELEGVALDKTSVHIEAVGGKEYLSASYFPDEAENLGFKWSTSNSKVAIVNNGTVIAMGEGTCVITVKDYFGNYSATCTITVGGETKQDGAEEKTGCGSIVGLGSAVVLLGSLAFVTLARKKED
ncbi:MAG: Ig-like domain-containing protein, partial [Clostridia bacterium]|nr:Ig-like domain-containing protein [Clostridia bacterium]